MPIDSNIALGVKPLQIEGPVDNYAKLLTLKDLMQRSQAGELQMQDAQRARDDEMATRQAYMQSGGDGNKLRALLLGAGNYKAANAYDSQEMARKKAQGEAEKAQLEGVMQKLSVGAQLLGGVRDQASYDSARATAQTHGLDVSRMPAAYDPAFIQQKMQEGQTVKEQLEQKWKAMEYSTPNANARLSSQTAIANNQANNARMAADAAAGRSVTMRGQNMTDARSKESNTASMSKPFEVTGPDGLPVLVRQDKQGNISRVEGFGPKAGSEKPMTDAQSKAALFGARMESADKILGTLAEGGTKTSIPGAKSGFGVGAVVNVLSSGKQQQLEQAKRDFVNAVLRRESGAVISDNEFDNADKQYFPQVGDSAAVIAQKASNRAIATRGVQAEVPKAQRETIKTIINGDAAPNIDSLLDKYK